MTLPRNRGSPLPRRPPCTASRRTTGASRFVRCSPRTAASQLCFGGGQDRTSKNRDRQCHPCPGASRTEQRRQRYALGLYSPSVTPADIVILSQPKRSTDVPSATLPSRMTTTPRETSCRPTSSSRKTRRSLPSLRRSAPVRRRRGTRKRGLSRSSSRSHQN